jgi:hypothetical protein
MSFDIWLDHFKNGEPAPFKREVFESIFLPFCSNREEYEADPKFMQVEYLDGGRADIYLSNLNYEILEAAQTQAGGPVPAEEIDEALKQAQGDLAFIQHVMFNHCGGDAFFADMYSLAERTESIIHWPDAEAIYVYTNEAIRKQLPEGVFDDSRSVLVRSGTDIVKAIETS